MNFYYPNNADLLASLYDLPFYLKYIERSFEPSDVDIPAKYISYPIMIIRGKEYRIHPKLANEYQLPELDKGILKIKRKHYSSNEEVKVLQLLGFDCTRTRKQGTDYVLSFTLNDGTIVIEPRWSHYSSDSINLGRDVFFKGKEEKLGSIISLNSGEKSPLCKNRFARYNKSIPHDDEYKFFPRYIAENINRFHHKAVGLSQHKNTRTVEFDIDNHNYSDIEAGRIEVERTLQLLMQDLEYPMPAMIERSYTGSYHIAILTNEYISDAHTLSFVNQFNKKYDTNIEVRLTTKLFRIPGHFTYDLGYLTYEDGRAIFIPFPAEEAFELYIEYVHKADASDYRLDYGLIEPRYKYKQFANTGSNIYTRGNISTPRYNTHEKEIAARFPLSHQKRDYNSFAIALRMEMKGADANRLLEVLNDAHTNSEDWSNWSHSKQYEECARLLENAKRHRERASRGQLKNNSDDFISSKKYVPASILDLLSNEELIAKIAPLKETSYAKNKEKIIYATRICMIEIIGRMLYECENPRRAKDASVKLEYGFQFPRIMQERLKKHKELKADVVDIFRCILNNKMLFQQYFHSKSGYKFKTHIKDTSYCKQFYPTGAAPECKDAHVIIECITTALESLLQAAHSCGELRGEEMYGISMCDFLNKEDNIVLSDSDNILSLLSNQHTMIPENQNLGTYG